MKGVLCLCNMCFHFHACEVLNLHLYENAQRRNDPIVEKMDHPQHNLNSFELSSWFVLEKGLAHGNTGLSNYPVPYIMQETKHASPRVICSDFLSGLCAPK